MPFKQVYFPQRAADGTTYVVCGRCGTNLPSMGIPHNDGMGHVCEPAPIDGDTTHPNSDAAVAAALEAPDHPDMAKAAP